MTVTGATIGSFDYMAPERFLAGPIDHTVDVYALACLFYECLTGQRPFPGDDLAVLLNAHLNNDPPRPTDTTPELPTALNAIMTIGMAKKPDARYSSAGQLAGAARAALSPHDETPATITATIQTLASSTPKDRTRGAIPVPVSATVECSASDTETDALSKLRKAAQTIILRPVESVLTLAASVPSSVKGRIRAALLIALLAATLIVIVLGSANRSDNSVDSNTQNPRIHLPVFTNTLPPPTESP